jgi:geranylgeranyl pyrophosphate synthase
MRQINRVELLNSEVEQVLLSLPGNSGLYVLLKEALEAGTSLTVPQTKQGRPWPLLPLLVCESICGNYEHAVPAAAALHLMKTAAEVFDDIEDADSTTSLSTRYGPAVALNAATTLLILAEKTVLRLQSRGVDGSTIIQVLNAINSFYTAACTGQHLDLSSTSQKKLSEEQYFEIMHMKSASTIECACRVGAILASADQQTVDKYTKFGYYLGMASQIANDIQGVTSGSDIIRRKMTLPSIFALDKGSSEVSRQLEGLYFHSSGPVPNLSETIRSLFQCGAVYYSLVKMQLFKQQALDFLSEVESSGKSVSPLKLFIEQS